MKWEMFLIMILLFGCTSQTEEVDNRTLANKTFVDFVENETEETAEIPGDMPVEIPEENTIVNITANVTGNVTNEKNKTEEKNETLLFFGQGKYALRLVDVTERGPDKEACAAVEFLYANKTLIDQGQICPGQDYYWTAPDGHKFRMVVTEVVAGYTKETVWAKVLIFG